MTLSTGERASACDSGRVKDRKSTTAVAISAKPNPAPGSFAAPKGMPAAAGRERHPRVIRGKTLGGREDRCFHFVANPHHLSAAFYTATARSIRWFSGLRDPTFWIKDDLSHPDTWTSSALSALRAVHQLLLQDYHCVVVETVA